MARACRIIGGALSVVGIAIALTFVIVIARDDAYRRAAATYALNRGNVMYEAEFRGAQVRRAFELTGTIAGILLAINGATLIGLGIVAARVGRK
jgi:hypothetical protein